MGASKPATYGRFKTSHQFQGFAFPFSLYPPSFPVQSIRNRLGFLFPPEARASRRHNIPADDRSPGCESHPDRLKPPPRQGPPSRGALWLVLNPRARLRAIRSTLKTTTAPAPSSCRRRFLPCGSPISLSSEWKRHWGASRSFPWRIEGPGRSGRARRGIPTAQAMQPAARTRRSDSRKDKASGAQCPGHSALSDPGRHG